METNFCILPSSQAVYSVAKVIKYLDEMGFKMHPIVKDGMLVCSKTDETFFAEELSLVGSFRFEGVSDPDDMSVIYALQADNGAKAVIVDAYGPYSDPEVADFIRLIRDARDNNPIMESIPPKRTIVITSQFN